MRSSKKHSNESKLINELKNDSVAAFNEIYELYFRRLYLYCHQFTKSHNDAEDMVQEIFTTLWITRHHIQSEKTLQGFIFRIARNRLISAYRTNINSPHYEEYLKYCDSLGIEDHSPMEYEEYRKKIETYIDSLPTSQRRILRMARFDMMPLAEIAQKLGISEHSVRNQISKALKTLKKRLELLTLLLISFC